MIAMLNVSKIFITKKALYRYKLHKAVSSLSLTVKPGSIYALLGPNGSGKTTTFRCISTLYKLDSGTITVMGHDTAKEPAKVRASIGFLSSDIRLSGHQSARDILELYGLLNKIEEEALEKRMEVLADIFDLRSFWKHPVEKYSTGQRQRAALAVSVIHDPPILLFDEPTNGLDILAAQAVWDFLAEEKRRGKTILLSTHIIEEAVKAADTIGLLLSGRLAAEGSPEGLKESLGGRPLQDSFLELIRKDKRDREANRAD